MTGRTVTLLRMRTSGSDSSHNATLGPSFASGGSSCLYRVESALPEPRVAKILFDQYRADKALDPILKIQTLVLHHDRLAAELPFVLWPDALVLTEPTVTRDTVHDATIGFTMAPLPSGTVALHAILKLAKYRKHFQTGATVTLAARLADHLARLHAAGFLFADLNPKNIHVSADLTRLHFFDADGYQIGLGGKVLPARGMTQGYASPAVISNFASNPTAIRSAGDDNFVLAILLFQLLVDRAHPFDTGGQFDERTNASQNDGITNHWYAYADPDRFKPQADALARYRRLALPLKEAFYRSFLGQPVTAAEWARLLSAHVDTALADAATPEPNPVCLTTRPAPSAEAPASTSKRRTATRRLPPVTPPPPLKPGSQADGRAIGRFRRLAAVSGVLMLLPMGNPNSTTGERPQPVETVTSWEAGTTVVPSPVMAPATARRVDAMLRAGPDVDALLRKIAHHPPSPKGKPH